MVCFCIFYKYIYSNLPAEATRTWITKTIAETDSDGTTHYITKLGDAYKVSGDNFYMQNGKAVLPLGTLTVEETKAPSGYLLDGAYMQAGDKSEQIKGLYLTQITEDGDLGGSLWIVLYFFHTHILFACLCYRSLHNTSM